MTFSLSQRISDWRLSAHSLEKSLIALIALGAATMCQAQTDKPTRIIPPRISLGLPASYENALGWKPSAERPVTALAHDLVGNTWVATEGAGVWRYDSTVAIQERWKQFVAQEGLGDDNIYTLAVDKRGRVWAGTLNQGVSVWNGKEWKNYGVVDGPLGERVFDIATCPTDGDVWIATNAGLTRYSLEKDTWSYVTRGEGLPSDQVQAITFDKEGNLIVGTQCDGVALSSAQSGYKSWKSVRGPAQMPMIPTGKGLPSSLINDVLAAQDGTIYVATTTGLAWSRDKGENWSYVRGQDYAAKVKGLYGGPPNEWKETPGAVLAEDYVSCLAEDEAGRIWLGHRQSGHEALETQIEASHLVIKRVVGREQSGFVRNMLSQSGKAPLLAKYNEGIGQSSLISFPNEQHRRHISQNARWDEKTANERVAAQIISATFPNPTAPLIREDLEGLRQRLISLNEPAASVIASYAGEDWMTGGDWLRGYGSRYAMLCAMNSPLDDKVVNDLSYRVRGRLGWNADPKDTLRHWLHRKRWDDPRVLYNPLIAYRRQADWDDHGEAYPWEHEGPDIWVGVRAPEGTHLVSLYFFNKDGHDGDNRVRDYLIEIRKSSDDLNEAEISPVLARARVRDFWGGVYKSFLIRGAGDYYVKIKRNNSFNTTLSAVFVDKINGPPSPDEGSHDVWMGRTSYDAPNAEMLADLEKAVIANAEATQKLRLQAAFDLWAAADNAYASNQGEFFQRQSRLMAYRAVLSDMGRTKEGKVLLTAWRWTLPLWPQEDRKEFADAMKSGWQSVTELNPHLVAVN